MRRMRPDHGVRDLESLVAAKQRIDVAQSAEICELQLRQSPIEGVLRYAGYSQVARQVLLEGIKVAGGNAIAVVVHARDVGQFPKGADVAHGNVEAMNGIVAAIAGERMGFRGVRRVVESVGGDVVWWRGS